MKAWNGKIVQTASHSEEDRDKKREAKRSSNEPIDYVKKFRETLNNQVRFEAFVDWMYREFSSENILSFIEFVQFKQWIRSQIQKTGGQTGGPGNEATDSSDDKFNFTFYGKMPRSSIVYDVDDVDYKLMVTPPDDAIITQPDREAAEYDEPPRMVSETTSLSQHDRCATTHTQNIVLEISDENMDLLVRCKKISHLLFEKYIANHAEQMINISGTQRERYTELDQSQYAGLEISKFITLFDELIGEMLKYINHSFVRFDISQQRNKGNKQ